jgi:hypothetical protein
MGVFHEEQLEDIMKIFLSVLLLSFLVSCIKLEGPGKDSGKDPEKGEAGDKGKKGERGKQGSISKSPCSSLLKKSETNCSMQAMGLELCVANIPPGACGVLEQSLQGMGTVNEVSSCPSGYIGCCKDHTDGGIQVHYSGKESEKIKCLKYGDVWMEP